MTGKAPIFPNWAPRLGVSYWESLNKERKDWIASACVFIEKEKAEGRIDKALNTETLAYDFCKEDHAVTWADATFRILSHDYMREAFLDLEKHSVGCRHLLLVASRGYMGPIGSEQRPRGSVDGWLTEIRNVAQHLAGLIEFSPIDDVLVKKFQRANAKYTVYNAFINGLHGDGTKSGNTGSPFFPNPSTLSGLLREISNNAEGLVASDLYMARPGDRMATRAYFVRAVTEFLVEKTGKPLRKVVAALTSAAFDTTIEESQVSRLAKINQNLTDKK